MKKCAENTVQKLWDKEIVAANVGLRVLQNWIWETKRINRIQSG